MVHAFRGRPLLLPPPAQFSLIDRIKRITCPVLIYYGADDHSDFKQSAAWLTRELPHAEQIELSKLGGFPGWEAPERVNRVAEEFLGRVAR